jgi:uncharacterized protein
MVDPRTGIERLGRDECLELLAAEVVGRLAVVDGGAAAIFPVNYVLDGDTVVFRTDPGSKLSAAGRSRASFEIDSIDREHRTGWSVVATGRLEEVTRYDPETFSRLRRLPVDPWASGDKPHYLRLIPDRITGRRVGATG